MSEQMVMEVTLRANVGSSAGSTRSTCVTSARHAICISRGSHCLRSFCVVGPEIEAVSVEFEATIGTCKQFGLAKKAPILRLIELIDSLLVWERAEGDVYKRSRKSVRSSSETSTSRTRELRCIPKACEAGSSRATAGAAVAGGFACAEARWEAPAIDAALAGFRSELERWRSQEPSLCCLLHLPRYFPRASTFTKWDLIIIIIKTSHETNYNFLSMIMKAWKPNYVILRTYFKFCMIQIN